MTQQEIIQKHWSNSLDIGGVAELHKRLPKMLDEWTKIAVEAFGRFLLWNDTRYDRGLNSEWGRLSFSEKQRKFYSEINDYL